MSHRRPALRSSVARWVALIAALVSLAAVACGRRDPSAAASDDASPPVDKCAAANQGLEDFLGSLDHTCQKDSDCDGYYLHADVCRAPTMLRVPGCPPNAKATLIAHQIDVRTSCDAGTQACSPAPVKPVCRAGACKNALSSE